MMKLKKKLLIVLLAGVMAMFSACAEREDTKTPTEVQTQAEISQEQYRITVNWSPTSTATAKEWVFDRNGNEIPTEKQFQVLYDMESGKPQCKILTKMEDTGKDDEYGNPVVRHLSALYDMDGNLLYDWQETDYDAAFGDFVIRRDNRGMAVEAEMLPPDFKTCLWNFKTGETKIDKVANVRSLKDESGDFFADDKFGAPLGIIDKSANVVSGFPVKGNYMYADSIGGGYFIATEQTPNGEHTADVLLNKNFEPLLSKYSINGQFFGIVGDYIICRDNTGKGVNSAPVTVMNLPQLETVFNTKENERLSYFDGELAIIQSSDPNDENAPMLQRLQKIDGTILLEDYHALDKASKYDDPNKSQQFMGVKDGTAQLIDREGKIIKAVEVPSNEAYMRTLGSDMYVVHIASTQDLPTDKAALLDKDFNIIIPFGTYRDIRELTQWGIGKNIYYPIVIGGKDYNGITRYDLLDIKGKVLVEDITEISNAGDNRIAVIKGYNAGLMDWNGNWIVKKSIFQDFGDY
ncbi:MAG: hypothetical protein RRZ73_06810 [Oscillospiraceae bacterium]